MERITVATQANKVAEPALSQEIEIGKRKTRLIDSQVLSKPKHNPFRPDRFQERQKEKGGRPVASR